MIFFRFSLFFCSLTTTIACVTGISLFLSPSLSGSLQYCATVCSSVTFFFLSSQDYFVLLAIERVQLVHVKPQPERLFTRGLCDPNESQACVAFPSTSNDERTECLWSVSCYLLLGAALTPHWHNVSISTHNSANGWCERLSPVIA